MKRFGLLLFLLVWSRSAVSATENTELVDQVNSLDQQELKTEDVQFQTFASCDEMSETLTKFVKDNFDQRANPVYGRGGGGPILVDDTAMADGESNLTATPSADKTIVSSSTDFSTTNIQVAGVDEPEILKSDGDYLYYYNQRLQKVFILRSPLQRATSTLQLSAAQVVATLAVPASFNSVQLFLHDNQLIVLGQRWSNIANAGIIDTNSKTDIAVYDVHTPSSPKLVKFSDLDGVYQDARLVDNTLYVVSQLGINRRRYPQHFGAVDTVRVDSEALLPKVIDISYTSAPTERNLTIAGKQYPYKIHTQPADCSQIHYILPTKESIQTHGLSPQFTVVRVIDLNNPTDDISTTTAFGNSSALHLTPKSLYLANYFWAAGQGRCPVGMFCIWGGGGEEKTLLHKFDLDGMSIDYTNSALLPGSPLNQRSMDEDAAGNFRILTTTRSPTQATHLITLDKSLGQLGSLLNIEPGEQFKASRFIDDKLYLVTFEQIDPLFAIDLSNLAAPKVLGNLKIPGYSTYLHPYSVQTAGVQRLVGIGYDTTGNQRGGTVNAGIKVDLYKVDYTKKDADGNIMITQEATKTLGGEGSDSEALMNPRLFVWNPVTKTLVLPMVLQNGALGKQCTTTYDTNGKVIGESCRNTQNYTTTFAGLKALSVKAEGITEVASYDYTDLLKQDTQTYGTWENQIYPRQLQNLQFRVGYLGDALYSINNLFAHFFIPNKVDQEVFVGLDDSIKLK